MRPRGLRYRAWDYLYRARRRALRSKADEVFTEIVAGWDQEAFASRFRRYWHPFPTTRPPKFLDLDTWLRESIYRYFLWTGLSPRRRGVRVLDLGAGTGYFLLVCRHFGHDVLGLDLDEEPLYTECFDFFGLPRIVHRIEPRTPLPPSSRFDLISAFMVCFHLREDGAWSGAEWSSFLGHLRERLTPGGRAILRFNVDKRTGELYSEATERALRSAHGFRARLVRDYAILDAR